MITNKSVLYLQIRIHNLPLRRAIFRRCIALTDLGIEDLTIGANGRLEILEISSVPVSIDNFMYALIFCSRRVKYSCRI